MIKSRPLEVYFNNHSFFVKDNTFYLYFKANKEIDNFVRENFTGIKEAENMIFSKYDVLIHLANTIENTDYPNTENFAIDSYSRYVLIQYHELTNIVYKQLNLSCVWGLV